MIDKKHIEDDKKNIEEGTIIFWENHIDFYPKDETFIGVWSGAGDADIKDSDIIDTSTYYHLLDWLNIEWIALACRDLFTLYKSNKEEFLETIRNGNSNDIGNILDIAYDELKSTDKLKHIREFIDELEVMQNYSFDFKELSNQYRDMFESFVLSLESFNEDNDEDREVIQNKAVKYLTVLKSFDIANQQEYFSSIQRELFEYLKDCFPCTIGKIGKEIELNHPNLITIFNEVIGNK